MSDLISAVSGVGGLLAGGGACHAHKVIRKHPRRGHELAMYDSIQLDQLPQRPRHWSIALAGYTDGLWPTYPALTDRYPNQWHLSITVTGATLEPNCIDVETGDASPALAIAWAAMKIGRRHPTPWLYASVSNWPYLLALLKARGIAREQVRVWTAHYTGIPHLCSARCWPDFRTTADATQWTDHALGRNLDQSLVAAGVFTRP